MGASRFITAQSSLVRLMSSTRISAALPMSVRIQTISALDRSMCVAKTPFEPKISRETMYIA